MSQTDQPELPAALAAAPHLAAHKFGGSSLADAACFKRVADIIGTRVEPQQVIVVSALRGVTDVLIKLAHAAASGGDWRDSLTTLEDRHRELARGLFGDDSAETLAWLQRQFVELGQLLDALAVIGVPARETLERIQGLGEVWSAQLLCELLRKNGADCAVLDAREVLVVNVGEMGAAVDWEQSAQRLATWREQHKAAWTVITGFIARSPDGRASILGRNGSDFSAAIFARLFKADSLTLWGDTNGVLSADPRLVPDAVPLSTITFAEACELAYFGARVIHPQALTPVITSGIPVCIRNTFDPERSGTRIGTQVNDVETSPVKGVSHTTGLALLTIEGTGLIGVPGSAERAFGALRACGVSVSMISQGSSEHSICCVIRGTDAERAQATLRRAFAGEMARGEVHSVQVSPPISVLAAVGEGMVGTPGISARLFSALARARVNVRAIAQGASERNISVAVDARDATRALRAAHSAFWLSPQTLSIGVLGPGHVGAALLRQIDSARARLLGESNLDLRVRAVANSRSAWLGEAAENMHWQDHAEAAVDLSRLRDHVDADHLPHAVLIDCSASPGIADHYANWLARGIHVVTPNKHAGSGPLARWLDIRAARAAGSAHFRCEATVGAGLPVIQTLRDLLDTGDELLAVDGILSGTLAWLFNRFDGEQTFSALVREAHALGYTEPDPRDDLAGTDVARKLVILAREAGRELALEDVDVESLVPESLASLPRDAFLDALVALDADLAARLARARENNCVLRYVAHLGADGGARVSLAEVPSAHAFAHLQLTDNIVQFTTARYRDNPLVVQGPGAGPEVTAAGVFADLLRVASSLGARL